MWSITLLCLHQEYLQMQPAKGRRRGPLVDRQKFLKKYCTSQEGLDLLTTLLQDAPVFCRGAHGPKQMPVKYQIMIWLNFFGHEGMTVKLQRETLETSRVFSIWQEIELPMHSITFVMTGSIAGFP